MNTYKIKGEDNYHCRELKADRDRLKSLVRELFELLDHTEESDGGKEFHPITISCCRVLMTERLNKVLTDLREASES